MCLIDVEELKATSLYRSVCLSTIAPKHIKVFFIRNFWLKKLMHYVFPWFLPCAKPLVVGGLRSLLIGPTNYPSTHRLRDATCRTCSGMNGICGTFFFNCKFGQPIVLEWPFSPNISKHAHVRKRDCGKWIEFIIRRASHALEELVAVTFHKSSKQISSFTSLIMASNPCDPDSFAFHEFHDPTLWEASARPYLSAYLYQPQNWDGVMAGRRYATQCRKSILLWQLLLLSGGLTLVWCCHFSKQVSDLFLTCEWHHEYYYYFFRLSQ